MVEMKNAMSFVSIPIIFAIIAYLLIMAFIDCQSLKKISRDQRCQKEEGIGQDLRRSNQEPSDGSQD